jgi:hypothetical protein
MESLVLQSSSRSVIPSGFSMIFSPAALHRHSVCAVTLVHYCNRQSAWQVFRHNYEHPCSLVCRDFNLSPWSKWLILLLGLIPNVLCLLADVSDHLVCSIFWVDENARMVCGWVYYRKSVGGELVLRERRDTSFYYGDYWTWLCEMRTFSMLLRVEVDIQNSTTTFLPLRHKRSMQ